MTSPIALSGCFLRRGVPLGTPNACMCFVCVCVCLFVCSSCLQFVLGPGVKCAVARWIDGCTASDFKASFSLSFVRLVGACVQHDVVSALSARSNVCGRFRNEHAVVRVDRSIDMHAARSTSHSLRTMQRLGRFSAGALSVSERGPGLQPRPVCSRPRALRRQPSHSTQQGGVCRELPAANLRITIVLFQVVSRKTHPPIFA